MQQTASMLSPLQIVSANILAGEGKTKLPALRILLLGIFAGMFIACGASGMAQNFSSAENQGAMLLSLNRSQSGSIALLDAVKAVGIPTVEVHISDPDTREDFRKISYIRQACVATIKGKGIQGYLEALHFLYDNAEEAE